MFAHVAMFFKQNPSGNASSSYTWVSMISLGTLGSELRLSEPSASAALSLSCAALCLPWFPMCVQSCTPTSVKNLMAQSGADHHIHCLFRQLYRWLVWYVCNIFTRRQPCEELYTDVYSDEPDMFKIYCEVIATVCLKIATNSQHIRAISRSLHNQKRPIWSYKSYYRDVALYRLPQAAERYRFCTYDYH